MCKGAGDTRVTPLCVYNLESCLHRTRMWHGMKEKSTGLSWTHLDLGHHSTNSIVAGPGPVSSTVAYRRIGERIKSKNVYETMQVKGMDCRLAARARQSMRQEPCLPCQAVTRAQHKIDSGRLWQGLNCGLIRHCQAHSGCCPHGNFKTQERVKKQRRLQTVKN